MMKHGVVTMTIVPVTCGKMDVKHVCVLIREIPPGLMERTMLTMTTTITTMTMTMTRTTLVIPIIRTGNARLSFYQRMLLADGLGSVKDASSNRGFCMKAKGEQSICRLE